MIIIRHRVNSINELLNIDSDHGVEIDLRSLGQELILEHEPFKSGVKLSEWLRI
jgi:hypothetical protein